MDKGRVWPPTRDLIVWWLFYKLDEVPAGELTPDMINEWYTEALMNARSSIHSELYEQYEEFRQKFLPPT